VDNASVIRIVLADRQEIFREGLKRLLESEPGFVVVGGAGTPAEVLQLVLELDPDVLLLDLGLHGSGSLEISSREIRLTQPQIEQAEFELDVSEVRIVEQDAGSHGSPCSA